MLNHLSESVSISELKFALQKQAETFCHHLFPDGRREAQNYLVGSLRGEAGRSLSICLVGPMAGRWKDFATGEGSGNLLDLLCAARALDFAGACRVAREWLEVPMSETALVSTTRRQGQQPNSTPYRLTDVEESRGTCLAERLISDPHACETIARWRGWQVQTVLDLACEASLGWMEDRRLVFLYDTGAKARWYDRAGDRRMRFLFGKADSLWRGGLLPIADRVLVCEGETDAISLVDAGAEADGDTLVVAVPGAGILKPHWIRQFAGKHLVLCMDADEAGRNATEKHKVALAPHVASLQTLNLGALL